MQSTLVNQSIYTIEMYTLLYKLAFVDFNSNFVTVSNSILPMSLLHSRIGHQDVKYNTFYVPPLETYTSKSM